MIAAPRIVLPELLDELDPNDSRATRSRRDLRRVHRAMGSLSILHKAISGLRLTAPPARILELGAGDATLLLRLARAQPQWPRVALTVLDRHDLLSQETRDGYAALGWDLSVLRTDVLQWAVEERPQHVDLCITTLFLHHFEMAALRFLMASIALRCDAFVACEPRRNTFASIGSRLLGVLACNAVTRGDAVKSVAAGFAGRELTAAWPHPQADWHIDEYAALPFTHCFTAVRQCVRRG